MHTIVPTVLMFAALASSLLASPPPSLQSPRQNDASGPPGQAATLIARACDSGNAASCRNLGLMYSNGRSVPQDDGHAAALYRRACEGADAIGCIGLGFSYESGRGVSKDESRAMELYRGACEGSIVLGCTNLGLMYANGRGVAKDDGRAVTLYKRACDGRIASACANLGFMYENGRGVEKDQARAVVLYQGACDAHNAYGCQALGGMYLNGRGVPKDDSRAVALFQRACEAGDPRGCTNLSGMYATGRATAPNGGTQPMPVPPPPNPPAAASVSTGTAFAISANGMLLTAYHVVDGAGRVAIRCPGNKVYPVTVSAKAPLVDLAILQTSRDVTFSSYLPLALDAGAVVGQRVFTVGYPAPGVLGLEAKFTEGTISSLSGLRGDASFLQVSVPIQPGNSGGALLDERGQVLGVVVSAAAPAAFLKNTGTLPQNINWAVKIAFASALLSQQPGTQAPSRNTQTDREQVIGRATAASCVVVAVRQSATDAPE